MRPKGKSDLQVMWAIRDISTKILNFDQKGFLLILLSIIGNKSYCHYSLPEMIDIFGIKRTKLIALIKSLEYTKVIYVDRPSKKGRHHTNKYFINYDLLFIFVNSPESEPLTNNEIVRNPNHLGGEIVRNPNHLGGEIVRNPNHLGGEIVRNPNHLGGEIVRNPEINSPESGHPYKDNKQEKKKETENHPLFLAEDQKQKQNGVALKELAIARLSLKHRGKKRAELESIYNEQNLIKH